MPPVTAQAESSAPEFRLPILSGAKQFCQNLVPVRQSRRRETLALNPPTHQVAALGGTQGGERLNHQAAAIGTGLPLKLRQALIQLVTFGTGSSTVGHPFQQAGPAFLQARQNTVAQVIAIELPALVAGVFHPAHAKLRCYLLQPVPTDLEPGPVQGALA